jgi:hypothetical protein
MPTTEHYGLTTGVVSDDFIQPEHNNRAADVLDRVVWNALSKLLADGAYSGWLMQSSKTVTPGEGLVNGCWCATLAAQAITGLTNGAVNYVFGQTDATSAPEGTIAFYGSTSPTKPSGHVYLGTIELDAGGAVVTIDNEAAGVDRNLYRLEVVTLTGSGEVQDLGAGQETTVEITHDPLRLVGGINFSCQPAEVTYEVVEHHRRDAFKVKLTNTGGSPVDVAYAWEREGVEE